MKLLKLFKANVGETVTKEEPIDEVQQRFILEANINSKKIVELFDKQYNGAFDYTEKSIAILDDLLENFDDFPDQINENFKKSIIIQAGSYISETARKNHGGRYYWNNQLNQPVFVCYLPKGEVSLFAYEIVKNRIEGRLKNIEAFYKNYAEKVQLKKISHPNFYCYSFINKIIFRLG